MNRSAAAEVDQLVRAAVEGVNSRPRLRLLVAAPSAFVADGADCTLLVVAASRGVGACLHPQRLQRLLREAEAGPELREYQNSPTYVLLAALHRL